MKYHVTLFLILLFVPSIVVGAQSTIEGVSQAQDTQSRGYWTDPSTGLMWVAKDNNKDVSWKSAVKYCRNLKLAGYSDWRLGTIDELQGIYEKSAEAPGENPRSHWHAAEAMAYHVKGNLFLTGDEWSSTQRTDDRGHPSAYVWYFDFINGRPNNDPTGWPYSFQDMRALCVRHK